MRYRISVKWIIIVSEIDKIKEEIGWLKILFGLLVAIDVSLIAWIVQNFSTAVLDLRLLAMILAMLLSCVIIVINRRAYRKIDELGEL